MSPVGQSSCQFIYAIDSKFTLVASAGTKLTFLLLSLVFYQEVWK